MSYPSDTILVKPGADENDYAPLDRIKVIGRSPIKSAMVGEWAGEPGDQWIIQDIEYFSAPGVMPESVLHRDYDVEYEPEVDLVQEQVKPKRRERLLSPEEQFRLAEKQADKPRTDTRVRTPIGQTGATGGTGEDGAGPSSQDF